MGKSKCNQAHTAQTQKGMGDYYGTGVRNPIGKVRSGTVGVNPASKSGLIKPPKKLA